MVLTVAVTGGIGAGKSTLARRWADRGAVLVDSDQLAREVVAPGTPGLAEVVASFGSGVLAADGTLDRAALAAIVFADRAARERLEAITHPRVRTRFTALKDAAPPTAIVVNDIPLLVDPVTAAGFHLVTGVHADDEVRVRRLMQRGLSAPDARARIAAQIPDERRRPLCDVWLDNDAGVDLLRRRADRLFDERLVPFRDNLLAGRPTAAPARPGPVTLEPGAGAANGSDPDHSDRIARAARRVSTAVGGGARVASLDTDSGRRDPGAIGLAVTAPDLDTARSWSVPLAAVGFPPLPGDPVEPGPGALGAGPPGTVFRCGSADPGLTLYLYVSVAQPQLEPWT